MKKIMFSFISGMLCMLVLNVGAKTLLTASDVQYNREGTSIETAQDAIDDLNRTSVLGKENIISKLNDKGLTLDTNSTYQNILDGIASLPIGKMNDGNWGYIKDGTDTVTPFINGSQVIASGTENSTIAVENGTYYGVSFRDCYGGTASTGFSGTTQTLYSSGVNTDGVSISSLTVAKLNITNGYITVTNSWSSKGWSNSHYASYWIIFK